MRRDRQSFKIAEVLWTVGGALDGVLIGHADFGASNSAPVSVCLVNQVLRGWGAGV